MPTVDGRGYLKWDDYPVSRTASVQIKVDGHTIEGEVNDLSDSWAAPGLALPMLDGTAVYQLALPRAKQPVTMAPMVLPLLITIAYQQDAIRLRRAAMHGLPILAFFNLPWEDVWLIGNRDAGQTLWRTSRRLAWNVTTITHTTHPPAAEIDGSQQTIITSGTPTAGQVLVPTTQTSGQNYETITAPSTVSGERLIVRYWPELVGRLVGPADSWPADNLWQFEATFEEILAGVYT